MENKKLTEREAEAQFKDLLKNTEKVDLPWREMMVERALQVGMKPEDHLELRVTCNPKDGDVFALARRATSMFFTAFSLYPTSLAVHSTVASLFEATESVFKAEHRAGAEWMSVCLGQGFEATPIRIEICDNLDIRTVAVRFSMDGEEYEKAMLDTVIRMATRRFGGQQ
jgi:hypothetical protein